jgi:hypothetical protein
VRHAIAQRMGFVVHRRHEIERRLSNFEAAKQTYPAGARRSGEVGAPRRNPDLVLVYENARQKGNANCATLAVARKLVAYLMVVDREQPDSLYEIKLAAMQGLEGLVDYASAMFALVFYLPAILLWLATILAGAAGIELTASKLIQEIAKVGALRVATEIRIHSLQLGSAMTPNGATGQSRMQTCALLVAWQSTNRSKKTSLAGNCCASEREFHLRRKTPHQSFHHSAP